ncbi:MAG: PEP/pyruvate-binding domain-containing protein [Bacteroidia bacterium]
MGERLFDKSATEVSEIGSKAYHLLSLQREGFRVPPFFVLSRYDVALLFGSVLSEVESIFASTTISSSALPTSDDLLARCERAQLLIESFEPPAELLQPLIQRCLDTFGLDYYISVRSSAMSEDSASASFAGQHNTYLYTMQDTLVTNIKKSLASAWGFGALSYRQHHGLPIQGIEYAMVLQQMVFATRAGIAFSMNSQGNMADAVINCGYGMGEGIVMDKVAVDCYHVNRALRRTTRSVVRKEQAMEFSPSLGIHLATVPDEKQHVAALTDEEIFEVFDLAIQAEKLLAKPADIEFVWGEDGLLYLLQMRPITTIHREDLVVLDNTNIVESYPNITLPLSYSFASMAYTNLFRRSAKAFWISSEKFDANHEVFDHLIEHFYGRVYYRLDNWYRMMALVYNSKRSMQAWETAVGLPDSASDSYKFPLAGKIKTGLSVLWLVINYKKGNRRFFAHFASSYHQFKQYQPHQDSPKELWDHLEQSIERTFEQYHLTIVNDYLAFKAFGWLQDAIRDARISDNPELANELVVGQGGVESELAVMAFLKIKAQVLGNPQLLSIFSLHDEDVLQKIQAPEYQGFYSDWQNYLERFGDRTLAELKLEIKSPRRNPELLVQLVKSQLDSQMSVENFKERQGTIFENAQSLVKAKLKWWMPRTWWFNLTLGLSRYGLANRENMRFCRTRVYSASKDIFLAMANLMVLDGVLDAAEDVFYLTMEEVKEFAYSASSNQARGAEDESEKSNQIERKSYREIVSERKETYENYRSLRLPDRIIYSKTDKPDLSQYLEDVTKEGVDLNEVLKGVPVSKGIAEGEALVITEPVLNADVKGKILISKMTDPGWVFLMSQAIALVTEKGSLLSHTAIVGRELGIPVVVAVQDVTQRIKTGERIRVNGSTGLIERLG